MIDMEPDGGMSRSAHLRRPDSPGTLDRWADS
jgi:hypothetical protein